MRKLTTEEFISKASNIHNNKYNYSKVVYINNITKITVTCKTHGDFSILPSNHTAGNGCKPCFRIRSRLSTEEIIQRSKAKHSDRFDYSKTEYTLAGQKIIVICKTYGMFNIYPADHIRDDGAGV